MNVTEVVKMLGPLLFKLKIKFTASKMGSI